MSVASGADAYSHPATGGDGDGDDQGAAQASRDAMREGGPCWVPPGRHHSAGELQDHARALNHVGFAGAVAAASKHSDPPCPSSRFREM